MGAGCVLAVLSSACLRSQPPMDDAQKVERVGAMYADYRQSFPEVRAVTVDELQRLRQGEREVVLVDVRAPREREISTIPGAVTVEAFERQREGYRDALVVAYCTIGYRSGLWARDLARSGFDAANLAGSILAWTHAGLPLVDPDGQETRRVHVYGPKWNLAAAGYEAGW